MVERNLAPGAIIHKYCNFTIPPKQKFLLVACVKPALLVLLINSRLNRFILERPRLHKCQVIVSRDAHPFLLYDSYADCVKAESSLSLDELRTEMKNHPGDIYKGRLTPGCIRKVISAVIASPTMIRKHKQWITDSLNATLEEE